MLTGLDTAFGIHGQALKVHERRLSMISDNISNQDTPHFQARDIDFKAVLGRESNDQYLPLAGNDFSNTNSLVQRELDTVFRKPTEANLNGNTVDRNLEQAAFMDAAVRYRAALQSIEGTSKTILKAIKGE